MAKSRSLLCLLHAAVGASGQMLGAPIVAPVVPPGEFLLVHRGVATSQALRAQSAVDRVTLSGRGVLPGTKVRVPRSTGGIPAQREQSGELKEATRDELLSLGRGRAESSHTWVQEPVESVRTHAPKVPVPRSDNLALHYFLPLAFVVFATAIVGISWRRKAESHTHPLVEMTSFGDTESQPQASAHARFAMASFVGETTFKHLCQHKPRRALPDGTNDEGEDIKEPLGIELKDVQSVTLYGSEYSPPFQKIKIMLNFYGVPFKQVNGRHPTSDYKKIPVLEVNGRQVNDSHIIVKNIAPVLTGKAFTPFELEWERKITFEFQPSIEVELFSSGDDFAKAAGFNDWRKALIGLAAPLLGLLIGQAFRSRYGDFPKPSTWGKQFLEACAGKPFFHGDEPGLVDLSLYGTYANIASKGCQCTDTFLRESGLQVWHARMAEAVKSASSAT